MGSAKHISIGLILGTCLIVALWISSPQKTNGVDTSQHFISRDCQKKANNIFELQSEFVKKIEKMICDCNYENSQCQTQLVGELERANLFSYPLVMSASSSVHPPMMGHSRFDTSNAKMTLFDAKDLYYVFTAQETLEKISAKLSPIGIAQCFGNKIVYQYKFERTVLLNSDVGDLTPKQLKFVTKGLETVTAIDVGDGLCKLQGMVTSGTSMTPVMEPSSEEPMTCAACIAGCCAGMGMLQGPTCVLSCSSGPCSAFCLAPTS